MKFLSQYINNIRALQFYQILKTGILLLISIIFTKINPLTGNVVLKTGEIGNYEAFVLISGFFSFFWITGIQQSMLSIYNNNKTFNGQSNNSIFFNIFLIFSFLAIFFATIIYVFESNIAKIMNIHGGHIPYPRLLFAYIVLSCPANLIEYIYLLKNKSLKIIQYGVIMLSLQLFATTVPIILTNDLGYGLYGLVFVNFIRILWLSGIIYSYSEIKISIKFIKEFAIFALPLALSILIGGGAKYFDNFLVSNKFGEATLAIFRYGAREIPFITLIAISFGNAFTPRFSDTSNISQTLVDFKKGVTRLMHYLFPITILILLTSKFIYPFVFNQDFSRSSSVFNIYIMIIVIRFVLADFILIGLKSTKIILKSSIFQLIINICLSILLIKFYGIMGVAIATVISYIFNQTFLIYYLNKNHKIKLKDYLNINIYLLYVTLLLIALMINSIFY